MINYKTSPSANPIAVKSYSFDENDVKIIEATDSNLGLNNKVVWSKPIEFTVSLTNASILSVKTPGRNSDPASKIKTYTATTNVTNVIPFDMYYADELGFYASARSVNSTNYCFGVDATYNLYNNNIYLASVPVTVDSAENNYVVAAQTITAANPEINYNKVKLNITYDVKFINTSTYSTPIPVTIDINKVITMEQSPSIKHIGWIITAKDPQNNTYTFLTNSTPCDSIVNEVQYVVRTHDTQTGWERHGYYAKPISYWNDYGVIIYWWPIEAYYYQDGFYMKCRIDRGQARHDEYGYDYFHDVKITGCYGSDVAIYNY